MLSISYLNNASVKFLLTTLSLINTLSVKFLEIFLIILLLTAYYYLNGLKIYICLISHGLLFYKNADVFSAVFHNSSGDIHFITKILISGVVTNIITDKDSTWPQSFINLMISPHSSVVAFVRIIMEDIKKGNLFENFR